MHPHVYSSVIYSNQDLEATYMSTDRQMDKEDMVYTFTAEYSSQFSSVTQSCLIVCDLVNCSTPGFPVHHQLPEFTQTHVHRVCDAE